MAKMTKEQKEKWLYKALKCLGKKHDCRVDAIRRLVILKKKKDMANDIGNRAWGHIDGLVNYMGFNLVRE